jgi:N-acetylmuramoyl-L-alanine amidase
MRNFHHLKFLTPLFAMSAWLLLLPAGPAGAQSFNLSALATPPDWPELQKYNGTMTRDRFEYLLENVYAPNGGWERYFRFEGNKVWVRTHHNAESWMPLEFAPNRESAQPAPRYWKSAAQLGPAPRDKPLEGVHIAIDPGHLGGRWSKMEERWFQIGDGRPVEEGNMTLHVAKLLEDRLKALGAKVSLVRKNARPTTRLRPDDLTDVALAELARDGVATPPRSYNLNTRNRWDTLQGRAELLFYRTAEIGARAERVNRKIRPDLVLALHFNAEAWGDPANPSLVNRSHFHILINGTYMKVELEYDDQRFEMLQKLLNESHHEELSVSRPLAAHMARVNNLPPYTYHGKNATRAGDSRYIWMRNLRANRLFEAPTIFLEPYIMNSRLDYQRIQLGDYSGVRNVNGRLRKSIFREYADSVAEGLAIYYRNQRPLK